MVYLRDDNILEIEQDERFIQLNLNSIYLLTIYKNKNLINIEINHDYKYYYQINFDKNLYMDILEKLSKYYSSKMTSAENKDIFVNLYSKNIIGIENYNDDYCEIYINDGKQKISE